VLIHKSTSEVLANSNWRWAMDEMMTLHSTGTYELVSLSVDYFSSNLKNILVKSIWIVLLKVKWVRKFVMNLSFCKVSHLID